MKKYSLNGIWNMQGNGFNICGNVPGSVYSFLHIDNAILPDPYYRDNEYIYLEISEHEYEFNKEFDFSEARNCVFLVCEGLDTLCSVYLNGKLIAETDNMHIKYEFDVTDKLLRGKNLLKIVCHPVNSYMKRKNAERDLFGAHDCMSGYPHIRKAHCMMGWDWGLRLPDAGIWRSIYLLEKDSFEIKNVDILQFHENGEVFVLPKIETDGGKLEIRCVSPDGEAVKLVPNRKNKITAPKLWWPNGLGEQNLYRIDIQLIQNEKIVDERKLKIGLRELKLIRKKDEFGESFYHQINGVAMFAMGADYIPEDNIFSRITEERTRKLLTECKNCHFNTIRVWGGGYYPNDYFFDICDELGIVVFLDLMFACAVYEPDETMMKGIETEVVQNIQRIRHHACLGVICGNNEIEWHFEEYVGLSKRKDLEHLKKVYLQLFEKDLPKIVDSVAHFIPYLCSSPTSNGGFVDPNNENIGDCHYWSSESFINSRARFFRYLSEFGICSYANIKTIESFTAPEDRKAFGKIMDMHQRNSAANGTMVKTLSETFPYANSFETLIFASQVLQAEVIKYTVEHLRRNRGRCMGALYWQVNDMSPVNSFSSIDYYGRYKALQYAAKRFYSPILISCEETGYLQTRPFINSESCSYSHKKSARICVTNDTLNDVFGKVVWKLCDSYGEIKKMGEREIVVSKTSAKYIENLDFDDCDEENLHLFYALEVFGEIVSEGSALFTAPKYYHFADPKLSYEINGEKITVKSNAYAKYVEISGVDGDVVLSDNYFDMEKGEKTVTVLSGTSKSFTLRSVYDIK
ncbi:MAG: glycoside hydrolase family 2 protein [Clostridia bacterium]|nr:glycoside hydrolase family 2 protein [Clostridia bacterium]